MLLNRFDGGLNVGIAKSLIAINESVINENVNDDSLILKSIKSNTPTAIDAGANGSIHYFNGEWLLKPLPTEFVEFNSLLYYATGTDKLKKRVGSFEYDVGIDAPTTKLNVVSDGEVVFNLVANSGAESSDLPSATYKYLLTYYIGDNYSTVTDTFVYSSSNGIQINVTLPSVVDKAIVYREYKGTYRFVNEFSSTGNTLDLTEDISEANSLAYLEFSEQLGDRIYCYTYYRDADGNESAPSEFSDLVENVVGSMTIDNFAAPTDTSVTHIRLYRLGGLLSDMYLVDELATNTTTYNDTKLDVDIVAGTLLSTLGTSPAPDNINHLTLHNSTLFGTLNTKLVFSEPGLVDRWKVSNSITFSETIIGLGSTQNGLLVFLKNSTFIVQGTSINNYTKTLLHNSQGCLSHKTIQYIDNNVLWLSIDGICLSNGGSVQIITLDRLGKLDLAPISAAIYDNKYFLFHQTGALVVDFRRGIKFKTLTLLANGAYYSQFFDKLYFIDRDNNFLLTEFATGNIDVPYKYKTGLLTEGSLTNLKKYFVIYIYVKGASNIKVYVNEQIAINKALVDGFNEIKFPVNKDYGYSIEIELEGTAEVFEIEYKAEGRANGR